MRYSRFLSMPFIRGQGAYTPCFPSNSTKGEREAETQRGEREWEFKFVTNKQRSWQNDTKEYVVNLFCRIEKRLQHRRASNCTDQRGEKHKSGSCTVFTVSSVYSTETQNTNYLSFYVCTGGRDAWCLRQDKDIHLENPLTLLVEEIWSQRNIM